MPSEHKGHELEVAIYGPRGIKSDLFLLDIDKIENIALECLDCNVVIADHDIDDDITVAKARSLISETIKEII